MLYFNGKVTMRQMDAAKANKRVLARWAMAEIA
jgi:hypothetical protein